MKRYEYTTTSVAYKSLLVLERLVIYVWNAQSGQPQNSIFAGTYFYVFVCFLANVNSCSCSLYVVVRPSVCRSSVTFVHPTQPIEIFGNVSAPFNTLVTWRYPGKILRRSSQGNPFDGGLNQRMVETCSDFGHFRGYISETVQDRR